VARAASDLFTPASDLENAYLRRDGGSIVPIDLIDLLYGTGSLSADPVLEHEDVLVIPFKQFQVAVLGAVVRPGSYPYVPNKSWRYYVKQAGGINPDLNRGQEVEIRDEEDQVVGKDATIGPEYTIVARRNAVRFWFLRSAELTTTGIDLFNAVYNLLQTFDVVEP
jgi:protein involved in polysaccharide export with SLBB domain